MLRLYETACVLPFFKPALLTGLPLIYHREHLFPYPSYGETDSASAPRTFRMMVVENESLRVTVAPELGGRIYSLFDKRIGQEVLFSNPVVKPVRILPVWSFISGGIEFNFPIAHSPTSMSTVGCVAGIKGDYGFIRVGEREARTGMEWEVEIGLSAGWPALVQRTRFRNRTAWGHPWMSWTIAAVRSTEETEFVHPPHRVLVHDDQVREAEWPGPGLNWDRQFRQMTALFWKPGSAPGFGAFHHDLGFGLMHVADPALLPGKKVWTYGHGRHRNWGQASTELGASYAEIESGPLLDQSEKPAFPAGATRQYEEYWIPVHSREACGRVEWPKIPVPDWPDEWLGWRHSAWQSEWEMFRAGAGPLPQSTVITGIDLESALRKELESGNKQAAEPLALWLAFRGRPLEAMPHVANGNSMAQRLAGLICWKGLSDPQRAVGHLEHGPLEDPIAAMELDELYAELGRQKDRQRLLARFSFVLPGQVDVSHASALDQLPNGSRATPGAHARIVERQADLALAMGNPPEAIRLLARTPWQREHQRYVRSTLWRKAQKALGDPDCPVPDSLGEDNLAQFGAYWSA